MYRISIVLVVVAFLALPCAEAQFIARLSNPQVPVTLEHPPGLNLTFDRIAVAPSAGPCSDELSDAVIQNFLDNNKEVIDRQNLEAVLAEHDFAMSGYVDRESAVQLGSILGPTAMIFLDVQRCATEVNRTYKVTRTKEGSYRTYTSRRDGYLKGSIRVVDLATGRIFAAQTFNEILSRENSSRQGYPEAPSEYEMLDVLHRKAVVRIHRLFFRWTETRKLYFFDDKKCNLKSAYHLLKEGNLDGAMGKSNENLESCRATAGIKPKVLSRAYYNVGMMHFIDGDYDRAIEFFEQANHVKPMKIIAESSAECHKAKQLAAQMERLEERVEFAARATQNPSRDAGRQQPVEVTASREPSIEERLAKVEGLYKKGLITEEEYLAKRAEILEAL